MRCIMQTEAHTAATDVGGPRSSASVTVLALLLGVHVACGVHTAWSKCVTHDEIWHLPVGILHWRTGEFDQDVLNPPLTRLWAAIPAAVAGVAVEGGRDATDIALKFVGSHDDYARWYLLGRVTNLVFSALTAVIVWRWAGAWFGSAAAVIGAALICASPNVVAHSSLVTPDAGLMLGFTATLWWFVRWREEPSWRRAIALGVVLGLAQATKFTAVLLYPLLAVLFVLYRPVRSEAVSETTRLPLRRWFVLTLVVTLISLVCWSSAFLFRGTGTPLAEYEAQSRTLRSLQSLAGPLADLPLPVPQDYVVGIDRQRGVMEQPHPIYLNGVWSVTGFRDYFLRTLEYKLPHVTQVLCMAGLLVVLFGRPINQRFRKLAVLLLPTVGLLTIASFSTMQLGVRYVLPVLPLLVVLASSVGIVIDRLGSRVRGVVFKTLVVAIGFGLRHHPHHLAYFNEWAGGPVGGRNHLLDSNLDWGQDLNLVADFMREKGLNEIGLVFFGTLPAERLGIRYHIPSGRTPEPGWHAVSVNYVMGRPHLLREPDGSGRAADIYEFAYFQQFEPVARLGSSIDVYHIGAEDVSPMTGGAP